MAETGIKQTMGWVIGISSIALVLLVLLIIFGNLSGNMGFVPNTGASENLTNSYNYTQNIITNVTSGVGKLTSQFPTILLFVGIGLLLFVLIGVLAWVIRKMSNLGGSNQNLG